MSPDLDGLLPLFLAEARERLERLADLSPSVDGDESAAQKVRRELHALKGASRMMRLAEISEVCHEGETLLTPPFESAAGRLVEVIDRLFAMVREIERTEETQAGTTGTSPRATEGKAPSQTSTAPSFPEPGGEVRIPTSSLAELADRATRLRILALGGVGVAQRVVELSRAAERSLNDDEPRQVLATMAASLRHVALRLEGGQERMLRDSDRLLERLLGMQMQPLRPFLQDLARHARELGRSLGKQLRVEVEVGDAELDRRLLVALEEVFLHLVRNAVDHGIEPPDVRIEAGKPAEGLLHLYAAGRGHEVQIVVTDDGGGIEAESILEAARARGVVSQAELEQAEGKDVLQLLFRPGFSMASMVTEISGRGVGLDAVAEAVRRVGGQVSLESTPGSGTSVHLLVPVMRRGDHVVVLRAGDQVAAVPSASVASFVG
ncbi:MAG: Hpt domain-containing protein, partial [Acidobacteria bacterium]|nr:Hpt domain-containing protein [Acidobacteriota bacterium]